jgi:CO/xanthine dehydrogenase Mo-binding subunit
MSDLPAHVEANPLLRRWVTVAQDHLVVHVGKVELGQGVLTAFTQLAADAFGVPADLVRISAADTADGPDQGLTAGSMSVQQTAPALEYVGGVVRSLAGPGLPAEDYLARVAALDGDLDLRDHRPEPRRAPAEVGRSVARLDLPDKVLGRPRYLADLRPDGLLHGRVLRPPSVGATLRSLPTDWSSAGITLVQDGSFLGVVGEREADVDRALDELREAATWDEVDSLPDEDRLAEWLRSGEHEPIEVLDEGPPKATHEASYSRPFLVHASIAPSAALVSWTEGRLQVWSHSQGIFGLRSALANTLRLAPEQVRVSHAENAGCYGHNGADDVALDAALLARAVPGRPVLLRWSRADELTWGPLASAMTATVSASLDDGRITGWRYDVWSQGHTARPGYRGVPGLLAGAHLAEPVPLPPATDPPAAGGSGTTRNAVPLYDVGPRRITGHRKVDSPLRTSAMRALGAFVNVLAIECFVDELAEAAGADPVEFRVRHLADERAVTVIREAARRAGWDAPRADDVGLGLGFARYKDRGAYCAVVAEVEASHEVRVRRLTVACDLGLVVNPDGARNQLEGGAVQATSWTTVERVRFDRRRITSDDWETYPVLTFSQAPPVTVHLVGSDAPPVGAGEAAQGPTAAAIANAIHDALGVRVRDLPLTAEAVVHAIDQQS